MPSVTCFILVERLDIFLEVFIRVDKELRRGQGAVYHCPGKKDHMNPEGKFILCLVVKVYRADFLENEHNGDDV